MPEPDNGTHRKPRRVSFAESSPPSASTSGRPISHTHRSPRRTRDSAPDDNRNNNNNNSSSNNNSNHHSPPKTRPASSAPRPAPSRRSSPIGSAFAGAFIHTVTNTPEGLIIDGVLRPRGPTHSDTNDNPFFPPYPRNPQFPGPYPPTMGTVGTGFMPDPNTTHYQPPVPDTSNGPFQYTYVPRTDHPGQTYVYPPGFAPGGPAFYVPGTVPYQQAQPGIATAPIPIVPPGCQPPPMQGPPMAAPTVNAQPGLVPPMAVPGMVHPTPPITPPGPGTYFVPGAHGGYEMGKTKAEVDAENQANAVKNQMYEPQGIKPADDDITRMYWVRELDGQWISRSRYSLDASGNFRWYVTENGVFYAVILPE
ncbi:hypothetical protein F4861DRAFT_441511 [Xylaria intraflava]|nr:hypothetical protein F4861DRAFT_441511 [Xylaria intraflava]